MKPIFKTTYGSHLYGTNVETSDTDIKGVFLPTADELLDCQVPSSFTQNTNNNSKRKNTAEDTDLQYTSLHKFMNDLYSGQTYAYEFLFAPESAWLERPDPIWFELLANKDKIVSKNVTAMVGYARAQAYKYGEKGKRLDVFKDVIELFKTLPLAYSINASIGREYSLFEKLFQKHKDFISVHKKENDISNVEYFDVNGVMVPLGGTVEYALEVYKPRLEEYGARAHQAAADRGNDLKAIYHSIRIANQAEELLLTGKITLPRPEAPLLLDVRNGKVSDDEMRHLIDESFERVRAAEKVSELRPNADKQWIKEFIRESHLLLIIREKNLVRGWWNHVPTYTDYLDVDD